MKSSVLSLIFLVLNVYYVHACKCEFPNSIKEAYSSTEVIVHGKVITKKYIPLSEFYTNQEIKRIEGEYASKPERLQAINLELIKIELEIKKTYKGNKIQNIVTIYTARNRASCGYPEFEEGKEFIGFLSENNYMGFLFKDAKVSAKRDNVFWTNQCTLTSLFDTKMDAELSVLSEVFKKRTDTSLLLGQWEAYKKTDLDGGDGSDVTLNGKPYTVRLELEFLDKGKSYFNNGEGKIETSYTIEKDTLQIVRFKYSIIELTDSKLVLKEEKLIGKLIYLNKLED